jgi:hypothetical protein
MVITATSVIKIWIKKCDDDQLDDLPIPGSQRHGHPTPAPGVSMTQLLILIFTLFFNLALMHSEKLPQLQFWDRLAIIPNFFLGP